MNGSSVYLLSVLKMKLKMAARRRLAASRGLAAPMGGPLSLEEEQLFLTLLTAFLDAMELPNDVHGAARTISTRRDAGDAAVTIAHYFEAVSGRVARKGTAGSNAAFTKLTAGLSAQP
jgi:hypothetical protein